MAGVLLLLCAWFSWVTMAAQQPGGAGAARRLAAQIRRDGQPGANILIVAKSTDDDAAFARTLDGDLARGGFKVVATVQGDPRDVRQALQKQADASHRIDFIATTAECGVWTVFENLPSRFPALGEP